MLDVLEALKFERCARAGNSLDGEMAWRSAVAAPQRVAKPVPVDAAGYASSARSVPLGFQLARMPVVPDLAGSFLPGSLIESSVRDVYGEPSRVSDMPVDRTYELTLREGHRKALVQRFGQLQPGEDAGLIATPQGPTLILRGGRDRLIPTEHPQAFVREIAGSHLVMFDDLGHVPHEEDPARTVAEVKRFLGIAPGM